MKKGSIGKRKYLLDKFYGNWIVDLKTNCWNWKLGRNKDGYGTIRKEGRYSGKLQTHRLSFMLFNGPIPNGLEVCHKCDNPSCVNPEHLFLGTHKDNMIDMKLKKRPRKKYYVKLTSNQKEDIIDLAWAYGLYPSEIARIYNISPQRVSQILGKK